jgi:hypothetical protein
VPECGHETEMPHYLLTYPQTTDNRGVAANPSPSNLTCGPKSISDVHGTEQVTNAAVATAALHPVALLRGRSSVIQVRWVSDLFKHADKK